MTIILAVSMIPPLFLLWRVYQNDTIEKEPFGLLLTIFLFGMFSTLPAGFLETFGQIIVSRIIDPIENFRLYNLLLYFIVVGGAEELAKFFAMKLPTWNNPEFNYVFDGVVYGVTASLGFAALENILYVLDSGLGVAGIRAWTAIPLHCITGIFMGHYYGIARSASLWGETGVKNSLLARSLLIPILIHGAYDFIATDGSELLILGFLVYIVVLDLFAFRALKRYSQQDIRMF